jgi:protocadherin Fat 1/2/3
LTTFTSHFCAESYSNYINIDDDEDSSTATTLASSIGNDFNAIMLPTAKTTPAALAHTTSLLSHHSSIKFSSPVPHIQSFGSISASNDEEDDDVTSIVESSTTAASSSSALPSFLSSSLSSVSQSSTSSEQSHQHSSSSEANEIPYQFKFAHPIYNVTIPENSVQKTFAIQPYSDKERMGIQLYEHSNNSKDDEMRSMHHIDVKYQIVGGDKNKIFKAEERIVGDFAFLTIRTRTNNIVLNREKGDNYRLRIKATVTRSSRIGTKKRTIQEAETLVDVKVLDKNDLSPLFYPTKYSITITDDTPLHQSILRVTAEDADVGINGGKFLTVTIFIHSS